jgi:hypothetical protein
MISDPELDVLDLKCFTVLQVLGWMLANQGGPLRDIGKKTFGGRWVGSFWWGSLEVSLFYCTLFHGG